YFAGLPSTLLNHTLQRMLLAKFPATLRLHRGALMRQIISMIYAMLSIAIWICVMGIVIAVLDSPQMLIAGGFVAAISTVTLVAEFIDCRSRSSTTKNALEQRSI